MTELEQQALLEPAAARTIDAAGPAWWGVDPGTLRVSIAWQHEHESGVATRSFPRAEGGKRLAFIRRETVDLVGEILRAPTGGTYARRWPGYVLVEQPSGRTVNPALNYAAGVIQEALWAALDGFGFSAPLVETISSSSWKKAATGRGDAGSKKRGGKAEIIRWAQANGYTGTLDDEADAWGIATAARRLVAFT